MCDNSELFLVIGQAGLKAQKNKNKISPCEMWINWLVFTQVRGHKSVHSAPVPS